MKGETLGILPNTPVYSISIHTPYAGGDAVRFRWFYGRCYFNPLPLCRGRHHGIYISKLTRIISIHSPYAGGDKVLLEMRKIQNISIHSPYAGGDHSNFICTHRNNYFNPLPLCRGRQQHIVVILIETTIC